MRSLDEDFAYEQLRQKRVDNMKTNEEYRLLEQQLAHLKTCSATEICAKNPNILEYCQQMEQQLDKSQKQIVMLRELLEIVQERGDLYSSDHAAIRKALDQTRKQS